MDNLNKNEPMFDDDYDEYGEMQYGHGRISDMGDDFDPRFKNAYGKIIEEKERFQKEFEEKANRNSSDEENELLNSLSEVDDADLQESARELVRNLNRQQFEDDKYYFSYVDPKVEKGFKIATEELRRIARENRGYINVDTDLKQLVWRDARIQMIAHGIHIENERLFRALLTKFFSSITIIPRTDGKVEIWFTFRNYYKVKEIGE